MMVFKRRASRAVVTLVATLLFCGVAAVPASASLRPRSGTPVDFTFKASPTSIASSGGTTSLSATFKNTEKCTLSVSPKVSSSSLGTFTCTSGKFSGRKVSLPADKTGSPIDYRFTLKLVGASGYGTVTIPAVEVAVGGAPPPLTFGTDPQPFGTEGVSITSAPVTITVTNDASTAQTISNLQVGGTYAGDFSINLGSNCLRNSGPNQLTPGQSCTVNVTFTPGGSGARSAVLQVFDSTWGSGGAWSDLTMNGTGQFATVSFSVSPLTFPDQGVNTSSNGELIEVTDVAPESGPAVPLQIGQIYTEGGNAANFAIYEDSCSASTVSPGQECSFSIRFEPGESGSRQSDVIVPDNASGSESELPVNGTAVYDTSSTLLINSAEVSSYDFYANYGAVSVGCSPDPCQTVTVEVSNFTPDDAPVELAIGSANMIGANPQDFQVQNDGCVNSVLAPDSYCTFGIEFSPTASGPRSATLNLAVNSGGTGYLSLNLTGNDPAL